MRLRAVHAHADEEPDPADRTEELLDEVDDALALIRARLAEVRAVHDRLSDETDGPDER